MLYKLYNCRGRLAQRKKRPPTNPAIQVGFSSKPKKYVMLKKGFSRSWQLMHDSSLKSYTKKDFVDRTRHLLEKKADFH